MMARKLSSGHTVVGDTAMSKPVYYVQECPTCGRRLHIRVAHLGKRMVCQHCLGEFEACDPANKQWAGSDSGVDLMARADDLLATAGRQLEFLDD
jgi:hypothetical protein